MVLFLALASDRSENHKYSFASTDLSIIDFTNGKYHSNKGIQRKGGVPCKFTYA